MMIGNWHYTPALTVRTWDAMMVNSPSLVKPLVPTDIWAPHVITSWNEHAAHWVMVLTISLLGPYTPPVLNPMPLLRDRKSTRLNSSHVAISYAVFCLKKKRSPPEALLRRDRSRARSQHTR